MISLIFGFLLVLEHSTLNSVLYGSILMSYSLEAIPEYELVTEKERERRQCCTNVESDLSKVKFS